jgi:hypothetical protein
MLLAPNTSTSLQTTLAADAHLAEGQFIIIIIIIITIISNVRNYNGAQLNIKILIKHSLRGEK